MGLACRLPPNELQRINRLDRTSRLRIASNFGAAVISLDLAPVAIRASIRRCL
jgi:hypothetical protein